jgi:uncharacterized membrane protein YccC
MNLRPSTKGIQLAVRAAVGAGLSIAIAQFLDLQHPIYALIAAVIVTDLTPSQTRQLGLIRIVATIVGAACGAVLTAFLPPGPLAIGVSILLAMLICEVMRFSNASKVAGFICGIVVFGHSAEPWDYALFRFIETALGIAVAWAISFVPKLLRVEEAEGGQPAQ